MTKPAILCVDDEPEVLGAVERDLRVHYRSAYRILTAGSGAEGLEAARQLKRRGTAVALFLVDERMPRMSGTEMLAEAAVLHPEARKVLLTAYADTEAAIRGINEVGLDHYLLKPWDPPELQLYPVLDDLLADWASSVRPPYAGIRLVGSHLSPQSYVVKEFLSRNQVPYQWLDVESDPSIRALVGAGGRLPVVLLEDGTSLAEPSTAELADRIGMHTHAARPFYDVAIIGAGPAGLAAAVYAASEGLAALIVEQAAPGGQAGTSSRIENYLGFPSGLSGAELARRAAAQARRFGAELLSAQEVVALRREDPYRVLRLADGTEVSCYALVLAQGVSVRRLDVPGVLELTGCGVFYGAAMTEAATYRGQPVVVVGGANSAGQGALFFSRYASTVTMIVRGGSLATGMSRYLVDRIEAAPNIEVLTGTTVRAVAGSDHLECVEVEVAGAAARRLRPAAMFIFIGSAPHTTMLDGLLQLDEHGYVLTGTDLAADGRMRPRGWLLDRDPFPFETSVPGVFAVGDVRAGSSKRVAAAVGEGSGCIGIIHRDLATV